MELSHAHSLDQQTCRRARLARDPRFDGEFFLGVHTTGIYCRPICPARPPAEKNVSYYRLASQAADAGYRPCLRCRPESAPGSPAWEGTATTVDRALNLILEGALDQGSLADLAGRLGIGERYLRKLFEQELGVSPQAVALNQRLLFAKKLLAETDMAITDVAFAAGFGSVRRFNSALQEHFRLTPTQLRGRGKRCSADGTITLQLQYRPPYDWHGVIDFFAHHEITAIERVTSDSFRRHFLSGGTPAWLEVRPVKNRSALALTVNLPDHRELRTLVQRVRRMFDLDANPDIIQQSLGTSTELQPLIAQSPGSRSPGHWSLFEASVRAIVGQQVSTVAARGICGRFATACSAGEQAVFPSAAGLAALDDSEFPMPGRRRETLQAVCTAFSGREDALTLTDLARFKGVGPWTVAMAAIRGAGEPNVFPLGDLGLVKAWEALGGEKNRLKTDCDQWSPWRSYAANLLWRSLSS